MFVRSRKQASKRDGIRRQVAKMGLVGEWALGDAKYSPKSRGVRDIEERLVEIDKYVAKYGHLAQLPEDRLNSEEFQEFERLQAAAERLRDDFDSFFARYHERIGDEQRAAPSLPTEE